MKDTIENIRKELRQKADIKTKESGERYFKENVKLYGVKTAIVVKIGKECFQTLKDKTKEDIFSLCEQLWQSGYMEESFIGCNWSYCLRSKYEKKDFKVFEKWVKKHVGNWASCDTLCNHTVGAFVEMYPEYVVHIKKWTKSKISH